MMLKLLSFVLSLVIVSSNAGVVDHSRCGGSAMPVQFRITPDCEGPICYMTPGTPYTFELDVIPYLGVPGLRLIVTVTHLGVPFTVIDTVLENSSVQPGIQFTLRYSIAATDVLTGSTISVRTEVANAVDRSVQVCTQVQAHVL